MRKILSSVLLAAACLAGSLAAPAEAIVYAPDRIKTRSGYIYDRDVDKLRGAIYSVTTTTTPASGSCAAQFVFKDSKGVAIAVPQALQVYLSNSTGLTHATAITSLAVLTNGALTTLVTGKVAIATTSAAGLLGITLTGSAATYYLTFVMPNGKLLTSTALVIN